MHTTDIHVKVCIHPPSVNTVVSPPTNAAPCKHKMALVGELIHHTVCLHTINNLHQQGIFTVYIANLLIHKLNATVCNIYYDDRNNYFSVNYTCSETMGCIHAAPDHCKLTKTNSNLENTNKSKQLLD